MGNCMCLCKDCHSKGHAYENGFDHLVYRARYYWGMDPREILRKLRRSKMKWRPKGLAFGGA